MSDFWICPSILAANFARLGDEVSRVIAAGADRIHLDIMDHHYVPNLTFGPLVCEALQREGIGKPMDVHLMVTPVDALIQAFAKAGARSIVFHPEASLHVDRSLQLIRDLGCEAGLVLNPATSLSVLDHVMDKLDKILLMSVNPGFGGQTFIPEALKKALSVRAKIRISQRSIRLEIDGGVKVSNIAEIAAAGVDSFVVGSAIFSQPDYSKVMADLRQALHHVPFPR